MGKMVARTLIYAACLTAFAGSFPHPAGSEVYEGYYLFIGAYPEDEETAYSGEGSDNTQGITHDENNWFISQTTQLWKIPVQYNLRHVNDSSQYPGVIHKRLSDYQELASAGYYHFGDMSYHNGYLVVAVEAYSPQPHAVALFRGDDLGYVGRAELPGLFPACYLQDPKGLSLGWVGVDPNGYVYSAGDCVTWMHKYSLNWNELAVKPPALTFVEQIDFFDEQGNPLILAHTQGGVFSESGGLLYMLTGIIVQWCPGGAPIDEDWMRENGGIHVFDTKTWRRVHQSTNGFGHFNYRFSPDLSGGCDEPEGITLWDLDKRCGTNSNCAPGMRGQLHAVMLDNEAPPDDDDFTLYHYSNTIHVDRSYTGEETGESHKPFNTIGEAYGLAWDGSRIRMTRGSYPGGMNFSKRVQLLAKDGTVRLGTTGMLSLTPTAAVSLSRGGTLRLY